MACNFNGNPILTNEEFQELISTDKGLREARYPIGYQMNIGSKGTGKYVNCPNYNHIRDITPEQHETACILYEQKRQEWLQKIAPAGILTFVTMGGDFPPKIENGIGNYRIRTYFLDKNNNKWFIELHPHYGPKFPNEKWTEGDEKLGFYGEWVDCTYEEQEEKRFLQEREKLASEYGDWSKVPFKVSSQVIYPRQKHGRMESKNTFTPKGILEYINQEYKTEFDQLFVERYFLSPDELLCKSK